MRQTVLNLLLVPLAHQVDCPLALVHLLPAVKVIMRLLVQLVLDASVQPVHQVRVVLESGDFIDQLSLLLLLCLAVLQQVAAFLFLLEDFGLHVAISALEDLEALGLVVGCGRGHGKGVARAFEHLFFGFDD